MGVEVRVLSTAQSKGSIWKLVFPGDVVVTFSNVYFNRAMLVPLSLARYHSFKYPCLFGFVGELVDPLALGASAFVRVGSSPTKPTAYPMLEKVSGHGFQRKRYVPCLWRGSSGGRAAD